MSDRGDERAGRFARAVAFAAARHAGQLRKGTSVPYITHPVAVAELLAYFYPDEPDLAVAGLLHDTLEDTPTDRAEIERLFGPEVRRLVLRVTKPRWRPWSLRGAAPDEVRLKAADTLHNVRCLSRDLDLVGPEVWKRFKGGRRMKLADYASVARTAREMLPGEPLIEMLCAELTALAARPG